MKTQQSKKKKKAEKRQEIKKARKKNIRKKKQPTKHNRAGTTGDLVYFKELSSSAAQNCSGFDSFYIKRKEIRTAVTPWFPQALLSHFRFSANFPPTHLSLAFTSLSQELCTQQQSCTPHASSHKHLTEFSLLVLPRTRIHSSWEVCLSIITSLPPVNQCNKAGSVKDWKIYSGFPGLEEIHVSSFIRNIHLQRKRFLFCPVLLCSLMGCINRQSIFQLLTWAELLNVNFDTLCLAQNKIFGKASQRKPLIYPVVWAIFESLLCSVFSHIHPSLPPSSPALPHSHTASSSRLWRFRS